MPDVKNLLKNIEENISLAKYTSFKIGGPAKYFYSAQTVQEIQQVIQFAKEKKLPYYILGGGNNILVSDLGFDGLVIKINNQNIKISGNEIQTAAGVILANLVIETADIGLTGLEWLAGIPGTVGGAIYGNVGAFGGSMGEKIEKVEVLNPDDFTRRWIERAECEFIYRGSIFKKNKQIILGATFRLEKDDLRSIRNLIKGYINKRKSQPLGFPSAGSVFKNIIIAENQKVFKNLLHKFPELAKFQATGKIPTGWFVEELGLLGKKIGGAIIAHNHGNFILNIGNAKATDVVMLISLIKQKIRVNFGIQLEEEIQYMGF